MRNPEYPLEQLATIKKKRLEEAEKVLSEKKQALIQEEEKLAAVKKDRDVVKEHRGAKLQQLRDTLDEGSTTDKIQQMKYYLKVVDEQLKVKENKVKDQQRHVDAAVHQVEIARQNVFKKHQEVEKLNLHRKEWEQEMKVIMVQKEGIETDEMGAAMHTLKMHKKKAKNSSSHHKKKS